MLSVDRGKSKTMAYADIVRVAMRDTDDKI